MNSSKETSLNYSPNLCIYQLLEAQAEATPDAIAITAPARAPLTYSRLCQHINRTVETLNAMNLSRNERVAIVLPNGAEMASAFIALSAGATIAPLNPNYRREEFDFYLSDLRAKALVIERGCDSVARDAAQALGISIIELSAEAEAGIFTLTGDRLKSDTNHAPAALKGFAQTPDEALVLHTSGTTSKPKIVPLTHANLCASALNIRQVLELTPRDRCLNVMPLFHIHGLVGAVLASLTAGASIVCTPGFYAPKFYEWMDEFQPTWYTTVPTMHQAILARAQDNLDIIARRPLRFIRSSSSALPAQVMAELERVFNTAVIEAYGMTEAAHQMTSNPLPPRERKANSVGIAANLEVAIMDEAGDILSGGEVGEIVIRGSNVTSGYENNRAANESAFMNGWFRTGDQGWFDKDKYLFITGRIKELINRGGEKISPREVDDVLMNHPAVMQAVTFAVPHAELGETVAAAIVLRENFSATETELREFAAARLAFFKVPQQVVIVDEIPKGATGKLQRIGLAEKLNLVALDREDKEEAAFVSPRNELEEAIARIWSEVLDINQIGVHDDFMRLGGDSVSATRIVARIREATQIELPLIKFFASPTVAGISAALEELLIIDEDENAE